MAKATAVAYAALKGQLWQRPTQAQIDAWYDEMGAAIAAYPRRLLVEVLRDDAALLERGTINVAVTFE